MSRPTTLSLAATELPEAEEWIRSVLTKYSNGKAEKAEGLKLPLKKLLSDLVDRQAIPPSTPPPLELDLDLPEDYSLVEHTRRKIAIASYDLSRTQKYKQSMLSQSMSSQQFKHSMSVASEDLSNPAHFSEFGATVKAHPFGKEKRSLDFSCNRSPGPAFYEANKTCLQQRPAIFFPANVEGRASYWKPKHQNPGPPQYYPSKHFLSERR